LYIISLISRKLVDSYLTNGNNMKKSKKIVAIGGGEIGRPGYEIETTEIDLEIIRLTRKKQPKLLFFPTASGDSDGYITAVRTYFADQLHCKVSALKLIGTKLTAAEIRKIILAQDIIYVGGGNTEKMIKIWKKLSVDAALREALERGIVLSGLSAGSICWFRHGNSDSRRSINPEAAMIKLRALNFIPALHAPHYDVEAARKPELAKMMKRTAGVAIAMDNCTALEVINDKYRIISSRATANAYKVYWKRGKFHEEIIQKSPNFRSLSKLLKK
jgi:dipeptidase E